MDNKGTTRVGDIAAGGLYRGLQALGADVHRHVHLENNVLIQGLRAKV
jgi:iron-sulfur cluster repair protein YtfE (RIC family)